jgi:hypothetical protein
MGNLAEVNENGTRLERLKELSRILSEAIDHAKYAKDLPPLSRQYRECLLEIELLESAEDKSDEISKLLSSRESRTDY